MRFVLAEALPSAQAPNWPLDHSEFQNFASPDAPSQDAILTRAARKAEEYEKADSDQSKREALRIGVPNTLLELIGDQAFEH